MNEDLYNTCLKLNGFIEYFTEDCLYAHKSNKCIVDVSMSIINHYEDKIFRLNYNNVKEDEIKEKIIDNSRPWFSGYCLFPIDMNKNKNNVYPYFIRKTDSVNTEGGLPIYIIVVDKFNDDKEKSTKRGGYFIDEVDKVVKRCISDFKNRKIEIYLSVDVIMSNPNDFVGILSHELQHAFDDNIIYKRSNINADKKSLLLLDFENNDIFGTKRNRTIYRAVHDILYAISKEEVKARETEIAAILSYFKNHKEDIKDDLIEYILKKDMYTFQMLHERFKFCDYEIGIKIHNLINAISNHEDFKKFNTLNGVVNVYKFVKQYESSKGNVFDIVFCICGYYMFKHDMLRNIDKYSPLTKEQLKIFFTADNVSKYISGRLHKTTFNDKIQDIVSFVYYNILLHFCHFFNNVYKIMFESLDDIYNIEFYTKPMLTENVLYHPQDYECTFVCLDFIPKGNIILE